MIVASRRAGFSILEALIVLAISGTALLLIFEMGASGSQRGFRLGNRALAAADAEPGAGSLRTIVRGARFDVVRPVATLERVRGPVGDSRTFSTPASLDRSTACAPAGPAPAVSLILSSTTHGDILTCRTTEDGPAIILIDLTPSRGRLSYSEDAVVWRDSWARRSPPATGRLYVRLTSDDGTVDIVEQADLATLVEAVTPVTAPAL